MKRDDTFAALNEIAGLTDPDYQFLPMGAVIEKCNEIAVDTLLATASPAVEAQQNRERLRAWLHSESGMLRNVAGEMKPSVRDYVLGVAYRLEAAASIAAARSERPTGGTE